MRPSLFSVFLDYWCNFECKHCSVGSSPKTIMPMPREILEKAFAGLAQVPTAQVVVFTGGEPTLRMEMLEEGIRMTKERGLLARVVTNGWWASSPEKAAEVVGRLRAAGLDEMNTSYDDFHAPFMKFSRIVNLVRASLAAGLQIGMGVILDNDATFDASEVRRRLAEGLDVAEDALKGRVHILEDRPTPTGNGKDLDVSRMAENEHALVGCPQIMSTVSLHPNGGVKACCGHAMFYAPDLTLGNLNDEGLPEILDRTGKNLLYWWIHMAGPKKILHELGVEGNHPHMCHACNDLLTTHRGKLLEHLEKNKNTIALNQVLLSGAVKQVARIAIQKKEEILARRVTP
jgi:MoaA/NifB/PqqE/SkfB family radical SAM enzyme